MLLHTLLKQYDPDLSLTGIANVELTGVRENSRAVSPGDLFVARPGAAELTPTAYAAKATEHAQDAIGRGAAAIVVEKKLSGLKIPQVVLPHLNAASAIFAHLYHHQPSEDVAVIGVTGTNGKTTTTYLIRSILNKVNQKCGLVGTVEVDDGKTRRPADMTTPSATDLAELLATMRDRGCRRCAMEVSSHALDQYRVNGIRFAGAGFTNLTGDHLDYHKTMDAYAAAKARLFESIDDHAVAVVNADDEASARMTRDCHGRIITFGLRKNADYQARDISITAQGTQFTLVAPGGRVEINMGLIGKHNIENALLASALVGETFGLSVSQIAAGLRDAAGAPGRLQSVRHGQPFAVLVDYAHTDDALQNVLTALRPLCAGKLRVLFGCGGNRDATKRPRMARVAQKYADAVYVTSDNPREEEPLEIIRNITAGFSAKSGLASQIIEEPDRAKAIERILSDAGAGDVVLLAGKGHEDYQIIGRQKHHFDDVEHASTWLSARWSLQSASA